MDLGHCSEKQVFFGEQSLDKLKEILNAKKHGSVLLVTGKESYEACGAPRLLSSALSGRRVIRLTDFETNPQKSDVERFLANSNSLNFTAIIAVGGGSVIDIAKLIKCFLTKKTTVDDYLYKNAHLDVSSIDLYVVPTTAGSGSEATHFAVLYDQKIKFSVAHPDLLPDAVWIVPNLLVSVPDDIAASAALDAFCQGVESYWSIHSTEESKKLASEAIKEAWGNMLPAVVDKNSEALAAMGHASHLAGKAINITKTTAPHAISYALTAHFGPSHGHAVALVLPEIFQFNADVTEDDIIDSRGVCYVQETLKEIAAMLGFVSIIDAASAMKQRMCDLGLPTSLRQVGVVEERDRDVVIRNGFNPGRVNNNPRRLTEEALRLMFERM